MMEASDPCVYDSVNLYKNSGWVHCVTWATKIQWEFAGLVFFHFFQLHLSIPPANLLCNGACVSVSKWFGVEHLDLCFKVPITVPKTVL